MKKKRLKLVTTIALLAALAGGSGGVAWGQAYKNGYATEKGKIELRRGDASPGVPNYIGILPSSTAQNNVEIGRAHV